MFKVTKNILPINNFKFINLSGLHNIRLIKIYANDIDNIYIIKNDTLFIHPHTKTKDILTQQQYYIAWFNNASSPLIFIKTTEDPVIDIIHYDPNKLIKTINPRNLSN